MTDPTLRTCGSCGARNRVPDEHLAGVARCGSCKTDLPPLSEPVDVDPALFERIVASARVPVLVDFWAPWCGPCRLAAPVVKKVASRMAGRAIVLKVETDRHPALAARFDVTGIPNLVVLKNGRVVSQHAGLVGDAEIQRWLDAAAAA